MHIIRYMHFTYENYRCKISLLMKIKEAGHDQHAERNAPSGRFHASLLRDGSTGRLVEYRDSGAFSESLLYSYFSKPKSSAWSGSNLAPMVARRIALFFIPLCGRHHEIFPDAGGRRAPDSSRGFVQHRHCDGQLRTNRRLHLIQKGAKTP